MDARSLCLGTAGWDKVLPKITMIERGIATIYNFLSIHSLLCDFPISLMLVISIIPPSMHLTHVIINIPSRLLLPTKPTPMLPTDTSHMSTAHTLLRLHLTTRTLLRHQLESLRSSVSTRLKSRTCLPVNATALCFQACCFRRDPFCMSLCCQCFSTLALFA
jgi:hypothetical protein